MIQIKCPTIGVWHSDFRTKNGMKKEIEKKIGKKETPELNIKKIKCNCLNRQPTTFIPSIRFIRSFSLKSTSATWKNNKQTINPLNKLLLITYILRQTNEKLLKMKESNKKHTIEKVPCRPPIRCCCFSICAKLCNP